MKLACFRAQINRGAVPTPPQPALFHLSRKTGMVLACFSNTVARFGPFPGLGTPPASLKDGNFVLRGLIYVGTIISAFHGQRQTDVVGTGPRKIFALVGGFRLAAAGRTQPVVPSRQGISLPKAGAARAGDD